MFGQYIVKSNESQLRVQVSGEERRQTETQELSGHCLDGEKVRENERVWRIFEREGGGNSGEEMEASTCDFIIKPRGNNQVMVVIF